MKIVVSGSRNYNNFDEAKEYIDLCINNIGKDTVPVFLSGGCRGADKLGERYAEENGFEIEQHPADWSKHGKSAGPIRNKIMAQEADLIICFWDGESTGTKSMIECARKAGKTVKIKMVPRKEEL